MNTLIYLSLSIAFFAASIALYRRAKVTMVHRRNRTDEYRVGQLCDLYLVCMAAGGFLLGSAISHPWLVAGVGVVVGLFLVLMSGCWFWIPGISDESAPTPEKSIIITDNEMLKTLERLCRAYASNNTQQIGSLEPIATKIGEELDRRGGITEMRRIFNLIPSQQGKRTLEMHRDGIGEWQG